MTSNENESSDDDHYVTPEFRKQLDEFLKNGGHRYKTVQSTICFFVVERIYRRVKLGYGKHFGAVRIDEEEGLIIDGNHRYIAYEMAGFTYDIIPSSKNHCDKPPYNEIKTFTVDYNYDWDMGQLSTRKYCSDDFLESFDREE